MIGNETNEIIEKLFNSLLQKYQKGLEESMKGSEFETDSVDLLHYNCHKINLNCVHIWLLLNGKKNKKVIINPKNNDDKCFQYAVTVALNHKNIAKDLQRISKIKLFIDQYN